MSHSHRVAILIDDWFPVRTGAQVHASKLAEALSAEDFFEVDLYTRQNNGSIRREERELERNKGIRFHRLPHLFFSLILFLRLLWARNRYHLYHAHGRQAALVMKMASWFTRVPTMTTVHKSHVLDKGWNLKKIWDRVLYLETKYTQEVSVSEHFLKLKNVNEPVLVIPNGVDTNLFDAVPADTQADTFTVISVGHLEHSKGMDVLLQAVKKTVDSNDFIQSHRDFRLHIVGEGPEQSSLEKQVEKLGLEKHVKFHGKVSGEGLIKLYKSADLFALASRSDSLPQSLLEAAAAGLPLLTTQVGDHKKVVLENVNGHLVPPGDVEELAYYLEHFALNPQLAQMGEASRDLVDQEYSWKRCIQKNLRAYERAMHQKKASRSLWMPWHVPKLLLRRWQFKSLKARKSPLRFCFTVNVEQAYAQAELPHEVDHVAPFLERFSEFCERLHLPSTLFVQEDLFDAFHEEIVAMKDSGHEIGVQVSKLDRSHLRQIRESLNNPEIHMLRSFEAVEAHDLPALHAHGFENIPVSEDPLPQLAFKWGLPFGRVLRMDLSTFLDMDNTELLASVNRLRAYQQKHKVPPFLIFECHSWEFQSRDHAPHAGGENFTELSKRLAFLSEHMELEFLSLSDFCQKC